MPSEDSVGLTLDSCQGLMGRQVGKIYRNQAAGLVTRNMQQGRPGAGDKAYERGRTANTVRDWKERRPAANDPTPVSTAYYSNTQNTSR